MIWASAKFLLSFSLFLFMFDIIFLVIVKNQSYYVYIADTLNVMIKLFKGWTKMGTETKKSVVFWIFISCAIAFVVFLSMYLYRVFRFVDCAQVFNPYACMDLITGSIGNTIVGFFFLNPIFILMCVFGVITLVFYIKEKKG